MSHAFIHSSAGPNSLGSLLAVEAAPLLRTRSRHAASSSDAAASFVSLAYEASSRPWLRRADTMDAQAGCMH